MDPPPPRYRIESDSSDEEGHGIYPSSGAGSRPAQEHRITLSTENGLEGIRSAVVGIGQASKYLVRRVRGQKVLDIKLDEKPVGAAIRVEDSVFIVIEEVETSAAFDVAKRLTESFPVPEWIVFSSYVPSMYIPAKDENITETAEVRVLSSTGTSTYHSPNYVTGVAGAFLSIATHPATKLEATLYLLPLPLSALPRSAVAETAQALPPPLAKQISQPSLWTEEDDERFAGPGMGLKPQHQAPSANDSMYM